MGQKVHPILFRLPVRRDWKSRWYAEGKHYAEWVAEDYVLRKFLRNKLRYASVQDVILERAGSRIRVTIFTGRPGIVIGRKGQELDKLREQLQNLIKKEILLDVQEVKKADVVAQLVAENVALQLARRVSFRRAIKKAIQTTMSMGAKGIRLQCSGRLGGAEIARTEAQRAGSVPLHTLRADVDYGFEEAQTVYGTIGVKCWICRADRAEG
ncbi:MAG: 30S ribosomal protein S3 [Puniceicoccales bacterium]|jgi:small subunit ribosomal protein S3|nr:30S ribosomal protein S3 [Puniceicoccales bacterium]